MGRNHGDGSLDSLVSSLHGIKRTVPVILLPGTASLLLSNKKTVAIFRYGFLVMLSWSNLFSFLQQECWLPVPLHDRLD